MKTAKGKTRIVCHQNSLFVTNDTSLLNDCNLKNSCSIPENKEIQYVCVRRKYVFFLKIRGRKSIISRYKFSVNFQSFGRVSTTIWLHYLISNVNIWLKICLCDGPVAGIGSQYKNKNHYIRTGNGLDDWRVFES